MDLKFDGKVALVTGSGKGIGEGVARGLAREGAIVIVHGRDKVMTEDFAHDIVALGGRAYPRSRRGPRRACAPSLKPTCAW